MFTLSQIQLIFDYGMLAYSQAYKKSRKDAINSAAKAAAAATTVANSEAKMASKVKQVFLTASMEATVANAHLSGNAFRLVFDRQLAALFKTGLEQLFTVSHIKKNENQSFAYGKGYYFIGLYHEAIITLESAIIEDPSCIAHAYYYLGKSNSCLKNHDVAKNYFLWLTQREQDPVLLSDYYDNIGMSYFEQGRYDEAIMNYDIALELNNINLSALHNKALAHLTFATNLKDDEQHFASQYSDCQTLLNNIFQIEPNYPNALFTQASLHELIEDYETAIAFYLRARLHCSIDDQETLSSITTNLAESYAQSGHNFYRSADYSTAQSFYQKALEEDAQHHIAKSQSGMCLSKLHEYNAARIHFNELINFPTQANPNQEDCNDNQQIRLDAWINRAACLRKTGALRLAKGSLDMAKDLSPNDETLHDETRELSAAIIQKSYRFFIQTKPVETPPYSALSNAHTRPG